MGVCALVGRTRNDKRTDETQRRQGGARLQECGSLDGRTDGALDVCAEEGCARPTFGVGAHSLARHLRALHHLTWFTLYLSALADGVAWAASNVSAGPLEDAHFI